MKSTRLFRAVWRINAFVILLAGLLAVGALVTLLWAMMADLRSTHGAHDKQEADVSPMPAAEAMDERASIGRFNELAGAQVLRAPLEIGFGGGRDYSSKGGGGGDTRNYLYYDLGTHRARWLMPDHDTVFLSERDLPESENGTAPVRVTVFSLRAAEPAPDAQRRQGRRAQALAIADADGRNFRVLVRALDDVGALWLDDADHLEALYTLGTKLYSLRVELKPGAAPVVTELKIARP